MVTDLHQYRARQLYEIGYCARANMELMIKNSKTYLKSDRSSCSAFQANQLRLFLHSAAYVLLHTLQKEVLKGTQFASSTMQTLQLKLTKVTTRGRELKTKVKIELTRWTPARTVIEKSYELFSVLRQ